MRRPAKNPPEGQPVSQDLFAEASPTPHPAAVNRSAPSAQDATSPQDAMGRLPAERIPAVRNQEGRESAVLEVRHLRKQYPSFALHDVSFSLDRGRITGLIGRNGAGKSTTLRAILGFVHPDAGEIRFFGAPHSAQERRVREKLGFVSGGMNQYSNRRLADITAVTRGFYAGWDAQAYAECLRLFELDERKTPAQLSSGMQVKYAVALALSHRAELLILDEPTSGLDPVSREELLELLLGLGRKGITVLFSTHITSDLERCADDILYIRRGRVGAKQSLRAFTEGYRTVRYPEGTLTGAQQALLIGPRLEKQGMRALIRAQDAPAFDPAMLSPAGLETVMVHLEKEDD